MAAHRELLAAVEPGRAEVKVLAVELDDEGEADIWNARAVWLDVEERDARLVSGTIVATELEREDFAEGDRLAVEVDRIFDLVLFDSEGDAAFNVARAEFAVGKRVLVGITELSHDGPKCSRSTRSPASSCAPWGAGASSLRSTTARATGFRRT